MRLDDLLPTGPAASTDQPLRLVVLPEVTKPENLGLVLRSAAAFGLNGVLLGNRSCDPLSRRCLRTSMGAALSVPFVRSADLAADLPYLTKHWGMVLFATVLDPSAEVIHSVAWPKQVGLLIGNEADGLASAWLTHCERRITIPMVGGVDSLNLGVAAGIALYELTWGGGRWR